MSSRSARRRSNRPVERQKKRSTLRYAAITGVVVAEVAVLLVFALRDSLPDDFEFTLYQGQDVLGANQLSFSELFLSTRPVVLNFWAGDCPPCRAEMPDLEAAFQRHKGDGVRFLGITNMGLDTAQDARDFIAEIGVTYSVGADTDASIMRAYGVSGFPSTVFLDAEQNLVRKWTGLLNGEKLEELIQEVLN